MAVEASKAPPGTSVGRAQDIALTALLICLLVIPARLVFAPLGGAGSPAQMLGLAFFAWWLLARLTSAGTLERVNPVVRAALVFLAAIAASYIAASLRPLPPLESSAADRGVISVVGFCGMAMLLAEKTASTAQLVTFLRRFSTICGGLGFFGLVQFVTGQRFIEYIEIPGLSANSDVSGLESRGIFLRPSATLVHPIEFGAVMTMALPLALHFAMTDTRGGVVRRWLPTLGIVLAVTLALTRSAIVSAVVVIVILLPTWTREVRRRAYAVMAVGTAVLYVTVPGLVGTLRGMFTTVGDDPSAKSRTDSYGLAIEFVDRTPIFGRGFRTFMPMYRILDNQYLLSLIETGVVGLLALLALLATAATCGVMVHRRATDPTVRSLGIALCAAVVAAACSFALFDAFSFAAAAGCLFCMLGASGALWRLEQRTQHP